MTFADVVAMATLPAEPSKRLHAEPFNAASDADPDPAGPCGPAGPAGPWAPCRPAAPAGPVAPAGPAGPVVPASPAAPAAPAGPMGPRSPPCPAGPAGPCGPAGPRSFQVTTRSFEWQAEASRTILRKPRPDFWQAVMTPSLERSDAPAASVAELASTTSAASPIPIVRLCTDSPFVDVVDLRIEPAQEEPGVRTGHVGPIRRG